MLSELASPGQPRGLSPIEARHVGQQFVDLQDQGADIVMMPRDDICRLIDTVVGHREVKLRSSERG